VQVEGLMTPYKMGKTVPWEIERPDGTKAKYEVEVEYYSGEPHRVTSRTMEPPLESSAEVIEIYGPIEKGKRTPTVPRKDWEKHGFTDDVLHEIETMVLENPPLPPEPEYEPDEYLESQGRLKHDVEFATIPGGRKIRWKMGDLVSVKTRRNQDGSVDVELSKGQNKTVLQFDKPDEVEQSIEMVEGMLKPMREMRFLAGLKEPEGRRSRENTPESAILRDWLQKAVGKSKLMEETSQASGDVIPPGFTFPDPLAFYAYAIQKLPLTIKRSVDRMTPEGQRAMEVVLEEMRKLRPAVDRLVEVFATAADLIDKYDGGSIEGREVARVFRYLMDAGRFVQGGAEIAESI
jgi:hypothetical protein